MYENNVVVNERLHASPSSRKPRDDQGEDRPGDEDSACTLYHTTASPSPRKPRDDRTIWCKPLDHLFFRNPLGGGGGGGVGGREGGMDRNLRSGWAGCCRQLPGTFVVNIVLHFGISERLIFLRFQGNPNRFVCAVWIVVRP